MPPILGRNAILFPSWEGLGVVFPFWEGLGVVFPSWEGLGVVFPSWEGLGVVFPSWEGLGVVFPFWEGLGVGFPSWEGLGVVFPSWEGLGVGLIWGLQQRISNTSSYGYTVATPTSALVSPVLPQPFVNPITLVVQTGLRPNWSSSKLILVQTGHPNPI